MVSMLPSLEIIIRLKHAQGHLSIAATGTQLCCQNHA